MSELSNVWELSILKHYRKSSREVSLRCIGHEKRCPTTRQLPMWRTDQTIACASRHHVLVPLFCTMFRYILLHTLPKLP
jgi:hypothetical protein